METLVQDSLLLQECTDEIPIDRLDLIERMYSNNYNFTDEELLNLIKLIYSLKNKNVNYICAFESACKNGHIEAAKWSFSVGLFSYWEGNKIFVQACFNGHFEIAKWLSTLKDDVSIRSSAVKGI